MSVRLVIVHDVLGTLFGFENVIEELRSIFKEQVSDERFAELIIMDWYHSGQRDFTTCSINNDYKSISECFRSGLQRILAQAKLVNPDSTQPQKQFDQEIIEKLMNSLTKLQPRPGMKDVFNSTYRDSNLFPKQIQNVELWGATNGGLPLAKKLFSSALGENVKLFTGKDAGEQQFSPMKDQQTPRTLGNGIALFSCDEIQIAKPDPKVYQELKRRILSSPKTQEENVHLWFVASHTWDLFAAKKQGFKTAWVSYEEFNPCNEIYGSPDLIGKDLNEIAKKIMEFEQSCQ